jgi:TonB-linked SusC/RagA family outer membrane protein
MKTKSKFILTLLLALVVQVTIAQVKVVRGVVHEYGTGDAIPGVNIVIKGTDKGVATDFDGKYSIEAKEGDVLVFSAVGYKTVERKVGPSNTINVEMKNGDVLDEVIVSAVAGATEKKKLSVSVVSVKSKDLKKVPANSAASALQGKVAGVSITNLGRPGQGATILLRGAANLYGSQSPLVIVDGVILDGGLSDINVDDIKTMEVVKGASASSYYGSKAGNGVIVITTKRGSKNKTNIAVRSELGFSKVTQFVKTNQHHHYVLAADWKDFEGKYTKYEGVVYPSTYRGVYAASGPDAVISGQPTEKADMYADNPYGLYNDHQGAFFKTGINTTNYVSISSGSDKSKMFFSAEKTDAEGIIKEAEGYSRASIRANIDMDIYDWLKLQTSNNYILINDHNPIVDNQLFRTVTRLSPEAKLLLDNPDGQPYYFKPEPWDSEVDNPLYEVYARHNNIKQNRFLGSYKLKTIFTDWANFDVEYAFDSYNSNYQTYHNYETYTTTGDPIGFGYSKGDLSLSNTKTFNQKLQGTLNLKKSFGELDFNGKLSYLIEDNKYMNNYTGGHDFLYRDLITFDNFDPTTVVASSHEELERAKNLFAIAGFVYKDRYIFDALYRNDQSSLFGPNNRNNNYYRVSAAWRVTEDIDIPGVQELKIHAAQGTSGQRPGYNWQYERIPLSFGSTLTDRIKGNPDLKPSLTIETEVGIDVSFLEKFDFGFTYSNQDVQDQFMLTNIFPPANNGFNKQWQNVGNLSSKTIEAYLNSKLIKKENFSWDLGINFTKSKAKIEELNVAQQYVGPDGGQMFLIREGEDFGNMYGYVFVKDLETMAAQLDPGDDISNYTINSDGYVVRAADIGTPNEKAFIKLVNGVRVKEVIGNQTPDFRMGFTSTTNYKNLSFYMLWDWKKGGDIYNRNAQWNTIKNRTAMIDQSGKPQNEKKAVPYYQSFYDVNSDNDFWVEDGSFVKLREVSLAYSFNKKLLSKIGNGLIKGFKVSLIGKNLLTFTNYSGWDPEVAKYDSNTKQYFSVDFGVYPNQKSWAMQVELKF